MLLIPLAALLLVLVATAVTATMVAVGYGGTVLASDDAMTWYSQPVGSNAGLFAVAHDGTEWIAVGSGGAIYTTPGGPATGTWTWTPRAVGVTNEWLQGVAADGNNFVAVGTNSATMTNSGTIWTPGPAGTNPFTTVAGDGNQWIAGGPTAITRHSLDGGYMWNNYPTLNNNLAAVKVDQGQWYAMTMWGATPGLYTSGNGNTWSWHGGPASATALATENGLVAATQGNAIQTTIGPNWTWTSQSSGIPGTLNGIAKCEDMPWVAVGNAGAIVTSPGGNANSAWAWAQRAIGLTPQDLKGVACSHPPLVCAAAPVTVVEGGTITIGATGGQPPDSWTAPGGSPSSLASGPTFSTLYGTAGTYQVTVSDGGIGTFHDATTCTVTVSSPPPLSCGAAQPNVAIDSQATFNAGGGTAPYTWNAPDGTNPGPITANPYVNTYPNAAIHTVQVTDTSYNQQTATCRIAVHHTCFSIPQADFSAGSASARIGQSIAFTDNSVGDLDSWAWDFGDGIISNIPSPSHAYGSPGTYTLLLTVSGPYCPTSSHTLALTIEESNVVNSDGTDGTTTPLADAGADQTVPEGTTVHLAGASRPAGARFEWTQVAGSPIALLASNTPNPTFIAPRLADMTPIQVTILLRVTDGSHTSPYDYVTVTITPDNRAPIPNAGPLQTAVPGQRMTLNGTQSRDPDGDPLNYTWTQTSGTPVHLENSHSPTATFTIPNLAAGEELRFQLHVTDGRAGTNDATLVIVGVAPAAARPGDANASPPPLAQNLQAAATNGTRIPMWALAAAGIASLAIIGLLLVLAARRQRKGAPR